MARVIPTGLNADNPNIQKIFHAWKTHMTDMFDAVSLGVSTVEYRLELTTPKTFDFVVETNRKLNQQSYYRVLWTSRSFIEGYQTALREKGEP